MYDTPPVATRRVVAPNRVLHGALTLATGGLWLIVWLGVERRYRKVLRRGY